MCISRLPGWSCGVYFPLVWIVAWRIRAASARQIAHRGMDFRAEEIFVPDLVAIAWAPNCGFPPPLPHTLREDHAVPAPPASAISNAFDCHIVDIRNQLALEMRFIHQNMGNPQLEQKGMHQKAGAVVAEGDEVRNWSS